MGKGLLVRLIRLGECDGGVIVGILEGMLLRNGLNFVVVGFAVGLLKRGGLLGRLLEGERDGDLVGNLSRNGGY